MVTHSNILAWRIPRTEEPGRLWTFTFSPGDLSDPEIELVFPALAGGVFTAEPSGKPCACVEVPSVPQSSWEGHRDYS